MRAVTVIYPLHKSLQFPTWLKRVPLDPGIYSNRTSSVMFGLT